MGRGELISQLALVFGVPLLGVIAGCLTPFIVNAPLKSTWIMLLLWALCFLMFLKAKLSLVRRAVEGSIVG